MAVMVNRGKNKTIEGRVFFFFFFFFLEGRDLGLIKRVVMDC